jgi:L-threonylcarbamoyladenylate synthase
VVSYFNCSIKEDVVSCGKLIDNGSIVIYPTDTVYGIGCNPFDDEAVLNLYRIKKRPFNKPLPVLSSDIEQVLKLVNINKKIEALMKKFWPGQLTLVLKLKNPTSISKYAFDNASNTMAIRIPDCQCTLNLIQMTKNKLLIGTSANLSGYPPVNNLKELGNSFLKGYDAVVDGGIIMGNGGVSTIISFVESDQKPLLIREGVLSKEKVFASLDSV